MSANIAFFFASSFYPSTQAYQIPQTVSMLAPCIQSTDVSASITVRKRSSSQDILSSILGTVIALSEGIYDMTLTFNPCFLWEIKGLPYRIALRLEVLRAQGFVDSLQANSSGAFNPHHSRYAPI
ncbi:hypothetical protein M422DRAFT_275900 [Sphaerobolus stellatus SS14]|uniref:Uncharacterized protein n=1 Tax=Sphaerobolus stellatus (strain SS14) TaxID=990650 RepID=A0A0C9UDK5_SPHS4|nr:hypothetical protein M422DRAFT_275900 [Sphaerobolus stellatus SS14]